MQNAMQNLNRKMKPLALIILDGFGHRDDSHDNAIALAYAIADVRGKQRPKDAANYQKNAANFAKNLKIS